MLQFSFKMVAGQLFTKDKRIDIYVQFDMQFCMAGQLLKGNVYLKVKAQTKYDSLYIRIASQQCSRFYKRNKNNEQEQPAFCLKRETYLDQFVLHRFESGILHPGNYSFPFSFVIPLSMPGSFQISPNNYIKYRLTAYLTSFDRSNQNQVYTRPLNIRQIPKVSQGIVQNISLINQNCPFCCCCFCCRRGSATVQIRSNKRIVNAGDTIDVNVQINNQNGIQPFESIQLILCEWHYIQDKFSPHKILRNCYNLKNFLKNVRPGKIQNFTCRAYIPIQIRFDTAVGAITAVFFQLTIVSRLGNSWCRNVQTSVRLFIYSRNLKSIQRQPMNLPEPKDLIVSPAFFYQGIKPFIYQPCEAIRKLNIHSPNAQPGDPNVNIPDAVHLNDMGMQNQSKHKPSFNNNKIMMNQDDPYQSNNHFYYANI